MIRFDPIYALFSLPDATNKVLACPEVQRLRDVALLNAPSVSIAALSEVKRYSHTLGVCHLADALRQHVGDCLDRKQMVTLAAAAAVHDVGTPPFGHTMEYLFRQGLDWSHEDQLGAVIRGEYRPENIHHQILPGTTLGLHKTLRAIDVDPEHIIACVRGDPPLGPVLAGSLDLDNVDNVVRMAHYLGLTSDADHELPYAILSHFRVNAGIPGISETARGAVERWLELRRKCYSILLFDEVTIAGQAMLMQALDTLIDRGDVLGLEYWSLSDSALMRVLLKHPDTRVLGRRLVAGDFFHVAACLWLDGSLAGSGGADWTEFVEWAKRACRTVFGDGAILYVYRDRGALSKRVELLADDGSVVPVGEQSDTIVLSVAVPSRGDVTRARADALRNELVDELGISLGDLLPRETPEAIYGVDSQKTLPL